jgi:putative flippase GtrA
MIRAAARRRPDGSPHPVAALARHSAVRFLLVGGVSYLFDAGSLYLLHGVARLSLALATTLAFGLNLAVNFGLNRLLTFHGATEGAAGRQLARYLVLVGANFLTTFVLVNGLAALGMNYLVAKTIATVLNAVGNYFAYRLWVFRLPAADPVEPVPVRRG